jgi:hypothetical protein
MLNYVHGLQICVKIILNADGSSSHVTAFGKNWQSSVDQLRISHWEERRWKFGYSLCM